MPSQSSPRSHVSSRSSLFSLWPSSLFGRPSDLQAPAPNQDEVQRSEATNWRSRGLGTISPWANAIPTIIVPDPAALALNSPTDLSEARHPDLVPSSVRPMPERDATLDEDDAFGHPQGEEGTCGPGPTQDATLQDDETTSRSVMTDSLESDRVHAPVLTNHHGHGHELTSNHQQEMQAPTSSTTPLTNIPQSDNETQVKVPSESSPTVRKRRPRSYGGERIPLSTFLAQRSLLDEEDMALVASPSPPTLDGPLRINITPAHTPVAHSNGPQSSTTLSRNPSSSTNASSHGPSTDDSHLQTPLEPAIIETPPSFGQLWDLMDRAKSYPFRVGDDAFERTYAERGDSERKEGGSKEDSLTQLKPISLDEFNDFGLSVSSSHTTAPLSTQPHPTDSMAAVATLGPAISFTRPSISARSSDTSLSTSSYFTAKPYSTARPSSTETNGHARRPSATKLKSASAENLVYHAITQDEGEESPSPQWTTHRPARQRDSPPSTFPQPDLPLSSTPHLPYHGPFDAYATNPDDVIARDLALRSQTGSPTSWIALSPPTGLNSELGGGERLDTSTVTSSRRSSLSLRAAPQPPRLIRSLTAPRKSRRPSPGSGKTARTELQVEDGERSLRPSLLPRSESFKRVFRRWSNRSSNTSEEPLLPHQSSSDLAADDDDGHETTLPKSSDSPERRAKKSFFAASSTTRLKKQRSVDDARSTPSSTGSLGRVPLPRASSVRGPPQPPPRHSSIPILIPSRSTSLTLSRKVAVSWAPSPKASALVGIKESTSGDRTIVVDDISAHFGPGSAAHLSKSERYRRCQSLVDINDDHLFKQLVEDMPDFETMYEHPSKDVSEASNGSSRCQISGEGTPRDLEEQVDGACEEDEQGGGRVEGAVLMTRSRSLPGNSETRAKRDHVSAWFVTREIVQGEKRYGRLLAKGVAILDLLITQSPLAQATKAHTMAPSSPSSATFTHHDPLADPGPLDILSNRLPQLLSLSISLSALFDLSPSPSGVSNAFVSLEAVLIEQLGAWASEIGTLLINGLSELLDVSISALSTPGASRSSSFGNVEDVEQDERLSFADIVIMPVQRALRYKLLFQDLVSKVPPSTQVHSLVTLALLTADKVAEECNARQTIDVSAFRRRPTGSSTKSVSISDETATPARLNKPDPRQKRQSLGKDRTAKKGHSKSPSVSSTKTAKEGLVINTATLPTTGKSSTGSASSRPKAKRRISAGPMGLNTVDSPIKTKDRSSWYIF